MVNMATSYQKYLDQKSAAYAQRQLEERRLRLEQEKLNAEAQGRELALLADGDRAAAQRAQEMQLERMRQNAAAVEFNARAANAADAEYYDRQHQLKMQREREAEAARIRKEAARQAKFQNYAREGEQYRQADLQRERDALLHEQGMENSRLASLLRLDEMPMEYSLRGDLADREAVNARLLDEQQQRGRLSLDEQQQRARMLQLDRELSGRRDMARDEFDFRADESQLTRDAERLGRAEELQGNLIQRGYSFSKPTSDRRQELLNQRSLILKAINQGAVRPGVAHRMLREYDEELATLLPDQPPDLTAGMGGGQIVEHPTYGMLSMDANGNWRQVARPPAGQRATAGGTAAGQQKIDPLLDQAIKIHQDEMKTSLDARFDPNRVGQIHNALRAQAGLPPLSPAESQGGAGIGSSPGMTDPGMPEGMGASVSPGMPPGSHHLAPIQSMNGMSSTRRQPQSHTLPYPLEGPRQPQPGELTAAPLQSIRSAAASFSSNNGPVFDKAVRDAGAIYSAIAEAAEVNGIESLTPEQRRQFLEASEILRRVGIRK